ncbi:hypothetical protein ACJ72_07779 [Emergomyces africanus]|uniref:Uncharacterized protein n=1 Tax=Emergomyces africanus TaxID=1955775 RepID=A0A1B7NM91_9EURO|nr:hypothetical protein ACJ72_07779 [Emergomyces africanus]
MFRKPDVQIATGHGFEVFANLILLLNSELNFQKEISQSLKFRGAQYIRKLLDVIADSARRERDHCGMVTRTIALSSKVFWPTWNTKDQIIKDPLLLQLGLHNQCSIMALKYSLIFSGLKKSTYETGDQERQGVTLRSMLKYLEFQENILHLEKVLILAMGYVLMQNKYYSTTDG